MEVNLMRHYLRRHILPLAALILMSASIPAGAAEIDQGTWVAGVLVGITNYANDSTLDDAISYGGRGAYFFRAPHGIEFDFSTGSTDINIQGSDRSFDITQLFLNYVHNFQMKKVSRMIPFMVFGMGKINVDDGTNSDWATTLQVGAGTRVSITKRSALRFDMTVFRWRGDGDVTPQSSYFSLEFTAGWSFFIGPGS